MKKVTIKRSLNYKDILNIQLNEFNARIQCRKDGVSLPGDIVFFVEHNPVYTIGKHGNIENLLLSNEALKSQEIEFFHIERGGDITYHGPGQITVYPIIDLLKYGLGIKKYIYLLEETVIITLKEFGIKGERIENFTGVWIDKGTSAEKICAIGVKCSRHITMHGFALNIGKDISAFNNIVPCGLTKPVTSISLETKSDISFEEVEEKLWKNINSLLQPHTPFPGSF